MTGSHLTVLGIESSCDETAAAIVVRRADGGGEIRSNLVRGQVAEHAAYGGIVPELAARAHVEVLDRIVAGALDAAGATFDDLSAIAVTAGPGLMGGLLVGTQTASAIAAARNMPLYAINHLEGHALTANLTNSLEFPYLLLLVSGGHTQILLISGLGRYRRLGTTIDDALGEAFDKTAKLLGLGFPGGPEVERLADEGNPARFDLPRPFLGEPGCNFSFSGLKTAVWRLVQTRSPLSEADAADICAAFQACIGDVLTDRIGNAFDLLAREGIGVNALVAAGGVAANRSLRSRLSELCGGRDTLFVAPPPELCTDNGAMIAWAGACRMAAGHPPVSVPLARARWPLDEAAEPVIGSGRKGPKA